jgi:hypothetical protein
MEPAVTVTAKTRLGFPRLGKPRAFEPIYLILSELPRLVSLGGVDASSFRNIAVNN